MPRLFRLLMLPLALGAAHLARAAEAPAAPGLTRGGKFEWARLETSDPHWDRHENIDPQLIDYIRKSTALNIDPRWQSVRARSIDDLRRYPLIFSKDISPLTPEERRNFGEYIRRGGFMVIDACRDLGVNSSIKSFLDDQLASLAKEFPDLRADVLPPTHPVFSIFFKMTAFPPVRPQFPAPLIVVYSGSRLIGIVGLTGFMCAAQGLDGPEIATESIQMLVNIYVYALAL